MKSCFSCTNDRENGDSRKESSCKICSLYGWFCTCMQIYTNLYMRVYIYIYTCIYICIRVYIYIYVCVVYIYTYVYIHIDMCVCSSRCLHKSRIWISTEETLCANVSTQVIARSTHCACRTITCKQDMMSYPPYRKVCLSVMSHLWSYV